jgi:hypothetical protein
VVTLTFRVGDHIFFICSLKNQMTCFCDFDQNYFEILLIYISKNAIFYLFHICPRFVSLLSFILWIIIFATKLRFGRNRLSPLLIEKSIILLKLAKFLSRPPNSIYFFYLMKINYLRCAKISFFFELFRIFEIFDFDLEIVWTK